jgi:catechol 2,3-dioxygenase-like lactoylglutathione lyase family enzyme
MAVELNHTIVPARDPKASADFLAGILGLQVGPPVLRDPDGHLMEILTPAEGEPA